jgi:adenylate cyclase
MEIERKFLVDKERWLQAGDAVRTIPIRQGYIARTSSCSVRIRIADADAYLTIKGSTTGLSREEFEYQVPVADAVEMLSMSLTPIIQKERHIMGSGPHPWEVDVFQGDNEGLILAEKELDSEDEVFELPGWVTVEVTGDKRYYNLALAINPIKNW